MKNLQNKVLPIFMAMVLVIGFVPMTIQAAENTENAQRNAWRYTDPVYIDMAIGLEVLAGTEVKSGKLEGLLYTVRSQAVRESFGSLVSVHKLASTINYEVPQIVKPYDTKNFYNWSHANRSAIANLAPLGFTDVTPNDSYAADLVMLTYYNLIKPHYENGVAAYTAGNVRFNGNRAITRTEMVDMLYTSGLTELPMSETTLERRISEMQGNVPSWALDSWVSTGTEILNREMTGSQKKEIAEGNLTRLEAAYYLAVLAPVHAGGVMSETALLKAENTGYNGGSINSSGFKSYAAGRFSDLTNIKDYAYVDWAQQPMERYNQLTGASQMNTLDVWNLLQFVDMGIMDGYSDGTIRPHAEVTRGEFASMLMKVLEVRAGHEDAKMDEVSGYIIY